MKRTKKKKARDKDSVAKGMRTGTFYWGLIGFLFSAPFIGNDFYVHGFKVNAWGHWVVVIFCVIMMLYGLLYKTPKDKQKNPTYVDMICPKCLNTFLAGTIEKNVCPQCVCELEPLTGFYDRHPELKSIKEKRPIPRKE